LDIFLLVFFTLFVFISGIHIIRRNLHFGGLYFFLFLYSIFAQIGYCFFPELSILAKAYFEKPAFYIFYYFNFASFVCFFILFYFLYPYIEKFRKGNLVRSKNRYLIVFFFLFLFFFYSYVLFYFITHFSNINYSNASDPDFLKTQGISYQIFAISFKSLAPLTLIFYIQMRLKLYFREITLLSQKQIKFLFLFSFCLLIVISNQIGSRTDIVALLLGILVFEFKMGLNIKKVFGLFMGFSIALVFMLVLEQTRLQGNVQENDYSFAQKFLLKDYYAPAHMLYTVINFKFIDPLFVLYSNFSNSLILLNVDYLQIPITELIAPGVANRSQGYAFYLFTEGYMFMGFLGFIYNGLMLMTGLSVWFIFYNTTNKYYNYLIFSLLSTQIANLARGQSSYFYKDLLLFLLPMLLVIFLSSGLRYKIKK